ncbi:hypothetical protein JI435_414720 [Parastagonospora nodorum SN15]|uniref:Uncharacterized protein n=1 Tax=Phaeosphaeria nodorum (strain SN15 / ATCC MYA-4574 / FGSC 10173) TaxID=321614 RepID=A0A7U2F7I6_PHANO|nr:hypothetical protein JI435_414720 [Parastagonospora nodorum SN15]
MQWSHELRNQAYIRRLSRQLQLETNQYHRIRTSDRSTIAQNPSTTH